MPNIRRFNMKKVFLILLVFFIAFVMYACVGVSAEVDDVNDVMLVDDKVYTEEEVAIIINGLLSNFNDINNSDMVSIQYNSVSQIYVVTEYNEHGDVKYVNEISLNELIKLINNIWLQSEA